jgi:hypothetical protein
MCKLPVCLRAVAVALVTSLIVMASPLLAKIAVAGYARLLVSAALMVVVRAVSDALTRTVYGRLLAADNTGPVEEGAYSDTIVATITY